MPEVQQGVWLLIHLHCMIDLLLASRKSESCFTQLCQQAANARMAFHQCVPIPAEL